MNTETHIGYTQLNVVGKRWRALYFGTVGAVAGFLASIAILGSDVIVARFMGFSPFMLLRYYATIREGSTALLMSSWTFFLNAFVMHMAVGSALGAVFVLIVSGRPAFQRWDRYVGAGIAFGLTVWIVNFYFLLSWIQPLINGRAYILESIPWWVGAGTHAIYGLTLAVVSYSFRNDVEQD